MRGSTARQVSPSTVKTPRRSQFRYLPRSSKSVARSGAAALAAVLILAACGRPTPNPVSTASVKATPSRTVSIYVLTDDPSDGFTKAARIAADEIHEVDHKRLEIRTGPINGPFLAGLTDRADVLGAITVGGSDAIAAARVALQDSSFPVFEMQDDLYETASLTRTVFQADIPHSWTAWRLARYFGAGDRGYSKIGLMREPSAASDIFASLLKERLSERNLAMVDATGDPGSAVQTLQVERPQAVVISGSAKYVARAGSLFAKEPTAYRGKAMIGSGWRPQIAVFEERRVDLASAIVVSDYAPCSDAGTPLPPTKAFITKAAKRKLICLSDEIEAYEAVHLLTSSKGPDRAAVMDAVEKIDRKKIAHLPISLGPDDHVIAERDHLGIWVNDGHQYKPIMRTFTSDLQKTDVVEEDWPFFFPGADPRGEAPFFYASRYGIVSDRSDDAH